MSDSAMLEDEYKIWRKNVPLLYDMMYTQVLSWPSPSIQWFPTADRSDNRTTQRLLMTTFTNGEAQEQLLLSSVSFPDMVEEDGVSMTNADIKFKFTQNIPVKSDVNKARYCPLATNIIACRTEDAEVLVYDYTKHGSDSSSGAPDTVFEGHESGGFALDWNKSNWTQLATGGRDFQINVWDLNDLLVSNIKEHSGIVNDVSYSYFNEHNLASVSDDMSAILHDLRSAGSSLKIERAHTKSIETCAFSPFKAELLATGASDNTVKVWDIRNTAMPIFILRGHSNTIVSAKWSPHYESILASCSTDRRVNIWDLNQSNLQTKNESSELLFVHGGHTGTVDDFDWNPAEPMEIASVANDGIMHIWKISLEDHI